MRICVFGAGAIGSHVAARLAEGGAEVCIVARGPHLAAVQAGGITVNLPDRSFNRRVAASADPRDLGEQDAVIVTTKAPALASVASGIGPLLGPETGVAFVMNGIPWWYFHAHGGEQDGRRLERLDPGGAVWDGIGPRRTIGGIVNSSCDVESPGVVRVLSARNRLALGEPDGTISPRVEALAAALRAGGLEVDVTPRIRDRVWTKLMGNTATGPLSVLTAASLHGFMQEGSPQREAARRVLHETAAIARAYGCDPGDPEAMLPNIGGSTHKSSILQDLELGRPMEIDALYATPLDMAREMGVAAPTLELLTALVMQRARVARLYAG